MIADRHLGGKLSTAPKAGGARTLSRRVLLAVGLGAPLAVGGCAALKASKAEAAYQPTPKGDQQCGNCTYYISTFNACTEVEGEISPDAWCKFWVHD